jgi:hypothetical protein
MRRRIMLVASLLLLPPPLLAQLPAPNDAVVSAGHLHLIVRDPEAP